MSAAAGKGSTPRPVSVSREQFADNWASTFGKKEVGPLVTFKIGVACKLTSIPDDDSLLGILGHITGIEGGIVIFSTPHGTVINMGFLAALRQLHPLKDREIKELKEFERTALLV